MLCEPYVKTPSDVSRSLSHPMLLLANVSFMFFQCQSIIPLAEQSCHHTTNSFEAFALREGKMETVMIPIHNAVHAHSYLFLLQFLSPFIVGCML